MPVRMCVIGVSAWSPVITWSIKPRSSEDDYNPRIGWLRAERQCCNHYRKRDKYSFHIYRALNVEAATGLQGPAGAAVPFVLPTLPAPIHVPSGIPKRA
jgi:hypothetical protein